MDKTIINLFRKLLALDSKTLPDSISPEDFGKLIEESISKSFISTEDFKKLQQTLSQKDIDLKKAAEDLNNLQNKNNSDMTNDQKTIADLKTTIEFFGKTINEMKTQNEIDRYSKLYPDFEPEIFIGRTSQEIETIVTKQRDRNKKLYGDSNHFAPPDFSTEAEIDEKAKSIIADPKKSGVTSAVEIMKLERQRNALPKD